MAEAAVMGWDIGGAHVKACLSVQGQVQDVVQWPCPLWQGLHHLQAVLDQAQARWPQRPTLQHVVTMTGEMTDLFADRRAGVVAITAHLAQALGDGLRLFAGPEHWLAPAEASAHWAQIASANWLATAHHAAQHAGQGVLLDIGSTTTDLIAFDNGQVRLQGRSDAGRLASGELVYHGVVRTPLCALGPRVPWRGQTLNVMNEFFATSADLYRLLGQLSAAHDQHPAADNGAKTEAATCIRLARMIGLDAADGTLADWRALAAHWCAAQVAEIAGQLRRVLAAQPLRPGARVVSAGCGDFLVPAVLAAAGVQAPVLRYGHAVARLSPQAPADTAEWAQVAAPAVAVAQLWHASRH